MGDIKRMDIAEFRKLGFLQEVNRRFFHPLGLALEVIVDDEHNTERLGGIWDYRENPEGISFAKGEIEPEKRDYVQQLWDKKAKFRQEKLGSIIQEK